jgi:aryl-alcohol dehydrogenase-like predicted oxidoreductase
MDPPCLRNREGKERERETENGFDDDSTDCRKLGSTGREVSVLGFGASALGGVFHDVTDEECIAVVHTALKSGINVIDTAPWYGQGRSEEMLGKALRGIPRNAYMLNTKVGRYEQEVENMFDFSAERITRSVDESLARMGVDYIDCIQVLSRVFCARCIASSIQKRRNASET